MTNRITQHIPYWRWLAGLAIVAIGLGLIIVNYGTINRQLHAWKLLPEPERLTELYFEDHTTLPATYTPTRPVGFRFTVHNLEYRRMQYGYQVLQQSEDGRRIQLLEQNDFTLGNDKYHTVYVHHTLADLGQRAKVIIKLTSGESISFWVKLAKS
jgi:hypothetical protein